MTRTWSGAVVYGVAAIGNRFVGAHAEKRIADIVCAWVTVVAVVIGCATARKGGEYALLVDARGDCARVLVFAIENVFAIRWVDRVGTRRVDT